MTAAAVVLAARLAAELAHVVHAPEPRAREVAAVLIDAGADEAEARALLVTAWHESSLRPEVERCEVRGAAGEVGLWQAKSPRGGHLCAGGMRAQARAALGHWRRCAGGLAARVRCYMGRARDDREVLSRVAHVEAMGAAVRLGPRRSIDERPARPCPDAAPVALRGGLHGLALLWREADQDRRGVRAPATGGGRS